MSRLSHGLLTLLGMMVPLIGISGAAQTATPSFTSKMTAPTAAIATGAAATLTLRVTDTSGTLSNGIIDAEIYNASGTRVKQQYWTGQKISAGGAKSYSFSWSSGTAGTFTMKIGVFGANWTPNYHWNNAAGTIQVGSSTPSAPAAPTGLTASPGNAQVSLAWTASTGAASYTVKRATVSGGPYTTIADGLASASYTDAGLTNGTAYYYVVAAVNPAGASANSLQASATPQAPVVSPTPAGLPSYFGLGLANDPGHLSWMTASNIPWNYRYQYLCGGVNSGDGWTTWNTPTGEFATYFMNNSRTNGYIPVFTYYQLVQSLPNQYSEDLDPKLQSASLMNAYFAEWKLLMQKCGAFGSTVIVHVEPDGWGYMQQTHGDDPAKTAVSVASSGFAEVAGYENNARGFAQALAALRNTYAPNVLLAWHASSWATNIDVILNHDNPVTNGTRLANFFNALGANFDLIFVDPSDRDAGYYQYVVGDGGAHWWQDADFVSYRQWIATITAATGRKAMLWQVPLGNTLYRTCNNTDGHYQDNHPQYFLQSGNRQHIVDYASAGVIGILFGRGADGNSDYQDSKGDGVTNPAAINGNTLTSTVADDDGGFLRGSAAAYYQSGTVPLPK